MYAMFVFLSAIYLTKRSLRNKQNHGLEDYEQVGITKIGLVLVSAVFYFSSTQNRLYKTRSHGGRKEFE